MMKLILILLGLTLLANAKTEQSVQCAICRQIFTALISQIGEVVSEEQVDSYLRFGCAAFGLDSWCQANVYSNTHDIFLALRSNKTDDIICERISLCHFRILDITGDILFADGDQLYTIRQVGDSISYSPFGVVQHNSLPYGVIYGLSCSVDYCAALLAVDDLETGNIQYGTVALSQYQQIDQMLPAGYWYGPWYDYITQEFWLATGQGKQYTFGKFDPQYGDWNPKFVLNLPRLSAASEILSGQILDRVLYFTVLQDNHVYKLDLALRGPVGNFTTPNNTMLVGNPLTNELYGYSPSNRGIWKYTNLKSGNTTTIFSSNLASILPVPSSTINLVDNKMWLSLWGTNTDAWLVVDLKTNVGGWAPVGKTDGLFDFNPYTITTEEA